jgi:hypothetical protein
LRCTTRLLGLLGKGVVLVDASPGEQDWYANRCGRAAQVPAAHARRHAVSMFAPDLRAGDVRPPGPLITTLVSVTRSRMSGCPPTRSARSTPPLCRSRGRQPESSDS